MEGQLVRLTKLEIAEFFQTIKRNASPHARSIVADGELEAESVVKESLTTAIDARRRHH